MKNMMIGMIGCLLLGCFNATAVAQMEASISYRGDHILIFGSSFDDNVHVSKSNATIRVSVKSRFPDGVTKNASRTYTGYNVEEIIYHPWDGDNRYRNDTDIPEKIFASGEEGNNYFKCGDGGARVYCGSGSDMVVGGDGNDVMFGGLGGDWLVGGNGWNYIYDGEYLTARLIPDGIPDAIWADSNDTVYLGREDYLVRF